MGIQTKSLARLALVAALTGAALLGGYAWSQKSPGHLVPQAGAPTEILRVPTPNAAGRLPDFSEIAAQQGPAVVNISVSGTVKTGFQGAPGGLQIDPNDPFFEFLKRFHPPAQQGHAPTHGTGSGFIVGADGVILTNAHVVADADEVTVKLTDRREFKAKVLGIDKLTDVAVLKINAKDLPTVQVGDSRQSRVGEWVVAIGSPFGFENTVTAGIVSAKARTLPDEGYVPFLQTDVAINPGNSGGPLFNLQGQVIGINSQIYSRSGGYQGLSFAIPIDVAMKVEQQLLDHGKVSRGRLGISIQDVSADLAESFGMDKPAGAVVGAVESGSPAEKAGIEPGDVVTRFNGAPISRSHELPLLVSDVRPGTKVPVTVWRQGKSRDLTVTVGELKADKTAAADRGRDGADDARLGLALRPLTPAERSESRLVSGLVVEQVAHGPAERAGIQDGDVILSVNGALVSSVEQLRARIKASGKKVALLVLRDNSRVFVPVDLG